MSLSVEHFVYQRSDYDKSKLRLQFKYSDTAYDLPITDINFADKYHKDNKILEQSTDIYLTISLGIVFEGWYYKLVAGIIYV
jgi:hypothetical protein